MTLRGRAPAGRGDVMCSLVSPRFPCPPLLVKLFAPEAWKRFAGGVEKVQKRFEYLSDARTVPGANAGHPDGTARMPERCVLVLVSACSTNPSAI